MAQRNGLKEFSIMSVGILLISALFTSVISVAAAETGSQSVSNTFLVTSTVDSGDGTLRQGLKSTKSGDTITFDPSVFPQQAPGTIAISTALPSIEAGFLTIDATAAGVILDGSNIFPRSEAIGFNIYSSGNTIKGMKIIDFFEGISLNYTGNENLVTENILGNNVRGITVIEGASSNVIKKNWIGVNSDGSDIGNEDIGVFVMEGCQNNVIGPNNILAYNGMIGIEIFGSNTLGNIITSNSIYNNYYEGIWLCNNLVNYPTVTQFDLDAGTIAGFAGPNSKIEIFSDAENEGKFYEGSTDADANGCFDFDKGTAFVGPHLTCTATAEAGTSQFSVPTSGSSRNVVMQEGNESIRSVLGHRTSEQLEDNHISNLMCIHKKMLPDPSDNDIARQKEIDQYVDALNQVGTKWQKLSIDMLDGTEAEETEEYSKYYIDPLQDYWITRLNESGINVIYILNFWDEQIKDIAYEPGFSRFKTESEIERYLDYVRFIVSHFCDKVKYYQIFNEPNNLCPIQYVALEDYIDLIPRVASVIKEKCPDAKIVSGCFITNPNRPVDNAYVENFINSNVVSLLDYINTEYFYDHSPEYEADWYYNFPAFFQNVMTSAEEKGFKGGYLVTDAVWSLEKSHFQDWSIRHAYSESEIQKYQSRAVLTARGMGIGFGLVDCPFRISVQNLCNVLAGAKSTNLAMEIQSTATTIKSCSFSLPNGDYLVGLWTDGVAVENDPGVQATLSLQGLSGRKVRGIDVLHGFEQEIKTTDITGTLTIEDLLVKDYPIILRVFVPAVPAVTTAAIASITCSSALGGGEVTSDGNEPVTAKGVCWSTVANPTITSRKTTDGTGIGSFTSAITGLCPGTKYHVRAYANNSVGTGYGSDVTFRTDYVSSLYVCNDGICGDKPNCHQTIANAVAAAETGSLIKVANNVNYSGHFAVSGKSLTIEGGWDTTFADQSGITTLEGTPTVSEGSVTIQQVKIIP